MKTVIWIWCISLLTLSVTGAYAGSVIREPGFDPLVRVQRRPLNPTHVYTYHVEGLEKGGGLFVMTPGGDEPVQLIDASEGVILDCQVSYDGSKILFSWKRAMNEPFGIWRINADGSGLTRVIDHESNNMNACWLPDGGIAFLSDRKPAFAYRWTSTSPVLYRADADGGNIIRLSANYLTDFTPSVMRDGLHYLVSRAGTILLRDYEGRGEMILCEPQNGMGFYSAQPLRPRALPRSTPVQRIAADAEPLAELLMHDVNIGLGGAVKRGEIKRIVVVQEMEKDIRAETTRRQFGFQFPVVSCGATYAPKRVWGFAKVEEDGSARFKDMSAALEERIDVDFRKVLGAQCGK